jgi:CBS domain-containing protein
MIGSTGHATAPPAAIKRSRQHRTKKGEAGERRPGGRQMGLCGAPYLFYEEERSDLREGAAVLVSQMLKNRRRDVVAIARHRPIREAARLMAEHDIGALLVRDGERICGILSERDIARGVARHGMRLADTAVETLMTPDLVTCAPGDDSDDLMRVMTVHGIRHLPVKVADRVVGMVSIRNIVQARLAELERDRAALCDYVAGTT